MPAFRTVLTYPNRIDAEIDRSMLAAEGMEVSLLHHDSPLTEVRGAFQIQLQVAEVDFARAVALLVALRPDRFGSPGRGISWGHV